MRGVVAACLLFGCYSPHPQAGAPCPDGVCPTGLVCSPLTQTCETTATSRPDAYDMVLDGPADAPGDGVRPLYLYRRRITIKNNAASSLPAQYTIRVPFAALSQLITDGKVASTTNDLRIIGDVAGERDRVIDRSPPFPATVINFPLASSLAAGATNTDFAIYYSRLSPPVPPQNPNAVWPPLFDDFAGNSVGTIWLTNDGPSVGAGKLTLRANHTDAITLNPIGDNVPLVSSLEMMVAISDPQSNPTTQGTDTFYYWFGFQRTGDFTATDPWSVWIARGKGQLHGEQKSPNGCDVNSTPSVPECDGPYVTQDTAMHFYTIERDTNVSRFYRDGTLSYTTATVTNTDLSPMFRNFAATSELTVDFVRARARVSPEPTVTVGAEENL